MSQLVASILIDMNVERDAVTQAPMARMRELLITQLISGYKLRELEVKEQLKNKFWDQD